jgi:hypothetical protein
MKSTPAVVRERSGSLPPEISSAAGISGDVVALLKWQTEQILILQQQVKELMERLSAGGEPSKPVAEIPEPEVSADKMEKSLSRLSG